MQKKQADRKQGNTPARVGLETLKEASRIPSLNRHRSTWKTFLVIIFVLVSAVAGLMFWASQQPGG